MKPFIYILIGFVAGIICTIGALFIYATVKTNSQQEQIEQFQEKVIYFDVKSKTGFVKLHTGMPKDSVTAKFGNPDDYRINQIQGRSVEFVGYKINNKYVADLNLTFVDGYLSEVNQVSL